MRRLATPALLILLPALAFLAFFHVAILDIGNVGWLLDGSDAGENALGLHAYRYDPAAGISLRTHLLNAPEGVPVLFTDSNPIVTLAAKLASPLLPADAQLVGPFVLLCLILQTLFAWALLRRHAPRPVALWAGVAMLAFPPTLFNRFIHTNLMAHWLILAALWLFLDVARSRCLRWWAPLIAVAALTHSYLLVMVGAIWATTLLVRVTQGDGAERRAVVGQAAAIVSLVAALALWLGVGRQQAAGSFGAFSMPLDALWNPSVPAFSHLLPAHEDSPGRGFEGFQYLGAGGLLLIFVAILAVLRHPADPVSRATFDRLRGLAPALIVLTILAVAHLPLPGTVRVLLDPIRASGRLFWPVGYVLVLVALFGVYRLSAARAALALIGVIAVQIVDLAGMAQVVRGQSAAAARHRGFPRTRDPRWIAAIRAARSITFVTDDVTRDLALFQEIAWRAVSLGRPVGNVYAARVDPVAAARLRTEIAAFDRGQVRPDRLYVLFDHRPLPAALVARARHINGVTLIVPSGR